MNRIICLIGGGHGVSNILRGMKKFDNLRIISAVTDRGGSTGKLRAKMNVPAMGDLRLIMTTLGDEKLRDIFETRIPQYKDCVGNLIFSSLIKLYSFDEAVKIVHGMLGVSENHRVIPVSLDNFDLYAEYVDGKKAKNETEFIHTERIEKVWIESNIKPNPGAITAIKESSIVIISPGSFYTSIIANLLIPDIAKEISRKTVIWIPNLIQQQGETIGLDLEDHFNILSKYLRIDTVIANNAKPDIDILKENYEGYLMPILVTEGFRKRLSDNKINLIESDLIDDNNEDSITHDYNQVYEIVKGILCQK